MPSNQPVLPPSPGVPGSHRSMSRGQVKGNRTAVPESRLVAGRFGRAFRHLPSYEPSDALIESLVAGMGEEQDTPEGDNPAIPAGFTYLGQFIDHDLTFDPVSSLDRQNDPEGLNNFRTPRFDLDSVYGRGPDDQPYLYERRDRARLRLGTGLGSEEEDVPRFRDTAEEDPGDEDDFSRNATAVIGDPRNDENIVVSQLQLAFLKFHNRIVDDIRSEKPDAPGKSKLAAHLWLDPTVAVADLRKPEWTKAVFHEAQRLARWHYQWVILTEFLPLTVGGSVYDLLVDRALGPNGRRCYKIKDLSFYQFDENPYIPVEFSVAAYRYGHSQARSTYHLNRRLQGFRNGAPLELFPVTRNGTTIPPKDHLASGRVLPPFWSIDWRFYFDQAGARTGKEPILQQTRRINTKLSASLSALPGEPEERRVLARRNLQRGRAMGLPSGQAVARTLCEPILRPEQLGDSENPLLGEIPLWYYVLREAELTQGDGETLLVPEDSKGGEHLGRVGGRIVAETFLGILQADPFSFLRTDPAWRPILSPDTASSATAPPQWGMADLLAYAFKDAEGKISDGRKLESG